MNMDDREGIVRSGVDGADMKAKAWELPLTEREFALSDEIDRLAAKAGVTNREVAHVLLCMLVVCAKDSGKWMVYCLVGVVEAWFRVRAA